MPNIKYTNELFCQGFFRIFLASFRITDALEAVMTALIFIYFVSGRVQPDDPNRDWDAAIDPPSIYGRRLLEVEREKRSCQRDSACQKKRNQERMGDIR